MASSNAGNAGHPDEVVANISDIEEKPSDLMAEAKLRHDLAETDYATPQEKKQAAVEQAHALSTRPDGSYAQLHETAEPTLAVADEGRVKELKKEHEEAIEKLKGNEPAGSPAAVKRDEDAAAAREKEAAKGAADASKATPSK